MRNESRERLEGVAAALAGDPEHAVALLVAEVLDVAVSAASTRRPL
jgi:hypothetical protein